MKKGSAVQCGSSFGPSDRRHHHTTTTTNNNTVFVCCCCVCLGGVFDSAVRVSSVFLPGARLRSEIDKPTSRAGRAYFSTSGSVFAAVGIPGRVGYDLFFLVSHCPAEDILLLLSSSSGRGVLFFYVGRWDVGPRRIVVQQCDVRHGLHLALRPRRVAKKTSRPIADCDSTAPGDLQPLRSTVCGRLCNGLLLGQRIPSRPRCPVVYV